MCGVLLMVLLVICSLLWVTYAPCYVTRSYADVWCITYGATRYMILVMGPDVWCVLLVMGVILMVLLVILSLLWVLVCGVLLMVLLVICSM